MGIKETIKAWLQPKDLSLILEIELTPRIAYQPKLPGFSKGSLEVSLATARQNWDFYLKHLEMLERKYSGRRLIIINGNETNDGKTRFYVEPAIRGKMGNITGDELRALYPNATPHCFPIPREKDRDRIYATA